MRPRVSHAPRPVVPKLTCTPTVKVEIELEDAEKDQLAHGDALAPAAGPSPATGAHPPAGKVAGPPPAGTTMGAPPVKKEKEGRRGRSVASMKSEERAASTAAGSDAADTTAYAKVEGKVCGVCQQAGTECRWPGGTSKSCARCVKQKCRCDGREEKPGEEEKAKKKGKAKAKDQDQPEEEDDAEGPSTRPAKKRKRDSRGSAGGSSTAGGRLDRLRAQAVQQAGATNIPSSEYGGPQPVEEQQMFPGLVADMGSAFEDGESALWGNFMNVAANSHLQIDGSVWALLDVQVAAADEVAAVQEQLEGIGESLAVIAGAALMLIASMPGNAPPVTRATMLGLGRGQSAVVPRGATPAMEVDPEERPEAPKAPESPGPPEGAGKEDKPAGSGAGGTGKVD